MSQTPEQLVRRSNNGSWSFQQPQVSPEFQNFEQKYSVLTNLDFTNPDQITSIEGALYEACEAISKFHSQIPDNFVEQSHIIFFLMDLLLKFESFPLIFERTSILLFYVLNNSKKALCEFIQNNPKNYILRLFNTENLKENQVCYEILIRLNDPHCKDIGCQDFFESLSLYSEIIERTSNIIRGIPLQNPENVSYKTNIILLLRVILGFTNAMPIEKISQYSESLFSIFKIVLTYENEQIRILLSKYAIYSLFFLAQKPLYKKIIEDNLFELSMHFIDNLQTASFATLLAIQMLQVSSSDNNDSLNEVKKFLPIEELHFYFLKNNDDQLLGYILTLFTNFICFDDRGLKEQLSSNDDLERLNQLIVSDNSDIQQRTIWCIWSLLRFGDFNALTRILSFPDLKEILVDISFAIEDILFIKSVLIPSIMSVSKTITNANVNDQKPYSDFMISLEGPLRDLCYKEDQPVIMSIAASCLKAVFPDIFESQNFS